MSNVTQVAAAPAIAALTGCSYMPPDTSGSGKRLVLAEQGYFFVGGHYVKSKDGQIRVGQMYVGYQIPESRTQPYPIVMWHGGNQTGTNFLARPMVARAGAITSCSKATRSISSTSRDVRAPAISRTRTDHSSSRH